VVFRVNTVTLNTQANVYLVVLLFSVYSSGQWTKPKASTCQRIYFYSVHTRENSERTNKRWDNNNKLAYNTRSLSTNTALLTI